MTKAKTAAQKDAEQKDAALRQAMEHLAAACAALHRATAGGSNPAYLGLSALLDEAWERRDSWGRV